MNIENKLTDDLKKPIEKADMKLSENELNKVAGGCSVTADSTPDVNLESHARIRAFEV